MLIHGCLAMVAARQWWLPYRSPDGSRPHSFHSAALCSPPHRSPLPPHSTPPSLHSQLPRIPQILAANQTPTTDAWFQGTADAVRQYSWLFEDVKNRNVQDIVVLSGDHLCVPGQGGSVAVSGERWREGGGVGGPAVHAPVPMCGVTFLWLGCAGGGGTRPIPRSRRGHAHPSRKQPSNFFSRMLI